MNQWNTKNLDELFDIGGKDLVFELIHLFTSESALVIQKLNEALKENKQEAIGQIAHKLKSSSGSLGLNELSEQCLAVDTKRRRGEPITSLEVEQIIKHIHLSRELLMSYKTEKS